MPARPVTATLHIGEVAERVGLSLRTVRYYEEQGLFRPPDAPRAASASTPTARSTGYCSSSR